MKRPTLEIVALVALVTLAALCAMGFITLLVVAATSGDRSVSQTVTTGYEF